MYHITGAICQFVILGLGLATVNLLTTFEISIASCYEDKNGGTKCVKWGGF